MEEFDDLELTPAHKEVLLQIAQKQLAYQLTIRTIAGEQDLITRNLDGNKMLEHIYPKPYLDVLTTEEGDWGRNKILARSNFLKKTNPPFYKAMKSNFEDDELMWSAIGKLYKARLYTVAKFLTDHNANFILGSDTPAMNMFTNPPGLNGFLEMQHMFEAGIPLEKIFRAATFNNARAFHMESLYGGVEKGKIANLLILNSNPPKLRQRLQRH